MYKDNQIFQSTLRRTERRQDAGYDHGRAYFNPRSDERSDHVQHPIITQYTISIHAPTNGATVEPLSLDVGLAYFNPRSDERSDLYCSCLCFGYSDFNPRSDERSDANAQTISTGQTISIHAPTNGAT